MTSHYKPGAAELANVDKLIIPDGKNKVTIKAPMLEVIWGADDRYWRKIGTDAKDGQFAMELVQVCWLEVSGSLELEKLEEGKEYKLEFMVRMKADAFGWNSSPVYLMAKVGDKKPSWKKVDLTKIGASTTPIPTDSTLKFKAEKGGDNKLKFGMYEIWNGRWKGGLVIEEVVISKVAA